MSNPSNLIKFWFEFSYKVKSEKPNYVYLHCFLDTCSDHSKLGSKDDHYYSQFKPCEKLSQSCINSETQTTSISTLPPVTGTTIRYHDKLIKNDITNSIERPIEQSYNNNRSPFLIQRPKSRYRGGGSSGNDYTDDNDFSRFQPQRVEEERIFLLKSISSSSSGCNTKFSYGPIYLEDKPFIDDDSSSEMERKNKQTLDYFSDNLSPANNIHQENIGKKACLFKLNQHDFT